jgi:hypothetical protein
MPEVSEGGSVKAVRPESQDLFRHVSAEKSASYRAVFNLNVQPMRAWPRNGARLYVKFPQIGKTNGQAGRQTGACRLDLSKFFVELPPQERSLSAAVPHLRQLTARGGLAQFAEARVDDHLRRGGPGGTSRRSFLDGRGK